jgi:hypothetical protein
MRGKAAKQAAPCFLAIMTATLTENSLASVFTRMMMKPEQNCYFLASLGVTCHSGL